MAISALASKHGIHPVTIHKWEREISKDAKKDSIDVHEILLELEMLKQEHNHLKKAVGDMAITNEILKTKNDILKKSKIGKVEVPKEVIQVLCPKCSKSRICKDPEVLSEINAILKTRPSCYS